MKEFGNRRTWRFVDNNGLSRPVQVQFDVGGFPGRIEVSPGLKTVAPTFRTQTDEPIER